MRFRATILLGGKTATGLRVPEEVVAGLGSGKRPAVRVTINGHSHGTTVAPRGGEYLVPVSAEHRELAGVAAGNEAVSPRPPGRSRRSGGAWRPARRR